MKNKLLFLLCPALAMTSGCIVHQPPGYVADLGFTYDFGTPVVAGPVPVTVRAPAVYEPAGAARVVLDEPMPEPPRVPPVYSDIRDPEPRPPERQRVYVPVPVPAPAGRVQAQPPVIREPAGAVPTQPGPAGAAAGVAAPPSVVVFGDTLGVPVVGTNTNAPGITNSVSVTNQIDVTNQAGVVTNLPGTNALGVVTNPTDVTTGTNLIKEPAGALAPAEPDVTQPQQQQQQPGELGVPDRLPQSVGPQQPEVGAPATAPRSLRQPGPAAPQNPIANPGATTPPQNPIATPPAPQQTAPRQR